ncbi:MAG: protein-(glutamine-N5) methyltransferase [Fibrobacteria bacterium]|nr:protein-(glutamine-N5) methyltransferase [Fibrobacteria bacterium]
MSSSPDTRLLSVLTKAADYLRGKSVPNPRLDAELLLARTLGIKRLDLYLQFDRPLEESELAPYRERIRRRGKREPLQHIEGECAFRELTLKCDRRALIPRPETEILVDLLKQHLPPVERPRVVDVGTGTGAILLSVTCELPQCEAWGGDVSPACLELTRENAALNGLPEPRLFESDLFGGFPEDLRWDAVVSNPPYIGEAEEASLEAEVREFDPRNALFGGLEGWEIPLALLTAARERLAPGGVLLMEIAPPQFSLLKTRALEQGWTRVQGFPDYQQSDRFLVAWK